MTGIYGSNFGNNWSSTPGPALDEAIRKVLTFQDQLDTLSFQDSEKNLSFKDSTKTLETFD